MKHVTVVRALFMALVCFLAYGYAPLAHAAVGDLSITASEEGDSAVLPSATISVSCDAGSTYSVFGITNGSGVVSVGVAGLGAVLTTTGCASALVSGGAITISVAKDGYVTKTSAQTYSVLAANTLTVTSIQFADKLTVTRESDSGAIAGATVTAGSGATVCIEAAGVYYCPVPVAQDGGAGDVSISKSGYVTNTSFATNNRMLMSNAQNVIAATGLKFMLKVVVADEVGTGMTADTITYNGSSPTLTASNTYYFALTGTGQALVVSKAGFTTSATTNTGLTSVTLASSGQTALTLGANTALSSITSAAANALKGLVYTLTPVTVAPGGGMYRQDTTVTLSTGSLATSIRYTTDGSTPSCTSGSTYGVPFTASVGAVVRTVACYPSTGSALTIDAYSTGSGGGGSSSPLPKYLVTTSAASTITAPAAPSLAPVPVATSTAVVASAPGVGGSSAASSAVAITAVRAVATPAALTPVAETRNLFRGLTGADVAGLQQYLNTHGVPVATAGAGAKGSESTVFSGRTHRALIKYQKTAGILPAVGYYGPVTRAYMAKHP